MASQSQEADALPQQVDTLDSQRSHAGFGHQTRTNSPWHPFMTPRSKVTLIPVSEGHNGRMKREEILLLESVMQKYEIFETA